MTPQPTTTQRLDLAWRAWCDRMAELQREQAKLRTAIDRTRSMDLRTALEFEVSRKESI